MFDFDERERSTVCLKYIGIRKQKGKDKENNVLEQKGI